MTLCTGVGVDGFCQQRNECWRYRADATSRWRSMMEAPEADGDCQYFVALTAQDLRHQLNELQRVARGEK
jgi:hypothetical protein